MLCQLPFRLRGSFSTKDPLQDGEYKINYSIIQNNLTWFIFYICVVMWKIHMHHQIILYLIHVLYTNTPLTYRQKKKKFGANIANNINIQKILNIVQKNMKYSTEKYEI